MANRKKHLIALLKIAISALLVYFIFSKINVGDVLQTLRRTDSTYLLLSIVLFVISKVISSIRLNLYFHGLGVFLTQWSNLKLYLLGMFYNLFLPGGIGGDAYKGYLIKKQFGTETKKVVSVLVLDRLSGMLLLFIYACILALFLDAEDLRPFVSLLVAAPLLGTLVFWWLNKRFFGYVLPVFWSSFGFSALVQLAQLGSAYFILLALQVQMATGAYLFLFLVSSIVSVLPLTIGGIGSREVTFFYGASWLSLDKSSAIGVSMVFFLITAFISLWGIVYHFKKPELETKKT
ncbi:MAG: lysylphosphatidylglycerol synthase transmembrane domain-containing protein [Sediminicola sp.]